MEHFHDTIGEENWFDYMGLYDSMINHFPDNSHFVEVGSWKGRSAAYMGVEILNSNKCIQFDCVDTWLGSEEHEGTETGNNIQRDRDWLFNEFRKNTLPISTHINPIRKPSLEASQLYKDRSLDFVFLDAAHDYENVKNDILSWYPKVKVGGWLAGHDYFLEHFGVKEAVNEVFKEFNFQTQGSCWLIKK
tara:strand:+ start:935 stop:1504 length:570 start_codon:yes stop_codon:yes gene_type:complete